MNKLSVLLVLGLILGLSITAFAGSLSVVSDGNEDNAVLAWVHPSWPTLDQAQWIWSSNPTENPRDGATETFTEEFIVKGGPNEATLYITADNAYEVFINDQSVGSEYQADTYGWKDIEDYDVTSSLKPGKNEIKVIAENFAYNTDDPEVNPGGVIYQLQIEYGGNCNNGVGNGPEGCNPGNAPNNDEPDEETGEEYGPGNPGNKGGAKK